VAFRPLHRLAERAAERALPGVDESADYLTERRLEVYRDAIEGALADGSISQRERAILGKLQESRGIEPAAARRIEAEVQAVLSPLGGPQAGSVTQVAAS